MSWENQVASWKLHYAIFGGVGYSRNAVSHGIKNPMGRNRGGLRSGISRGWKRAGFVFTLPIATVQKESGPIAFGGTEGGGRWGGC